MSLLQICPHRREEHFRFESALQDRDQGLVAPIRNAPRLTEIGCLPARSDGDRRWDTRFLRPHVAAKALAFAQDNR